MWQPRQRQINNITLIAPARSNTVKAKVGKIVLEEFTGHDAWIKAEKWAQNTKDYIKMEAIKQQDINWTKMNFSRINIGGVWAVPRSGLIFTRISENHLRLTAVMPWDNSIGEAARAGHDLPPTAKDFWVYQNSDYECIKRHHEAAGIVCDRLESLNASQN